MIAKRQFVVLLTVASCGALAQQLDLKGLKFDEATSEDVRVGLLSSGPYDTWTCRPRAPTHVQCIAEGTTYASRPVDIAFTFVNDRLAGYRVKFAPGDFNHIVKTLADRFGPPRVVTSKGSTVGGAQIDQVVATWPSRAGEALVATRYAGSVEAGSLILWNQAAQAAEAAVEQQQAAKARNDT